MKYLAIKNKLEALEIFTLNDIYLIDPDFRLPTLYEWKKKGYVEKIRNKWYYFTDNQPKNLELYRVANKIYSPSYVSLDLALNHYGIIPEAVMQITSISTLRTNTFDTDLATFIYKNIAEELFFGYRIIEETEIKIATLEKALLDKFYLDSKIINLTDLEELRLNFTLLKEELNKDRFSTYSKIFDNKRLNKLAKILLENVNN